jgi:CubicO group peptidase (beta-lactamase class C family)
MMAFERRDVLKMGALLGGAACVPAGLSARGASSAGQGRFTWKLASPAAAGLSRDGLERMRAAVQKNIDGKAVAGAVTAVARHNKLVWFEAQGWANIGERKPMHTDSLFHMMSSTKVVTAVAALMMIEEGRLALKDPVSRFIPSFKGQKVAVSSGAPSEIVYVPAARDITILDLLTHTSGLSTSASIPAMAELRGRVKRGPGATLASQIPQLGSLALDYQPGTLFRYSALDGFETLLYIVELVSGAPAEQFLHERLFQPLDMRDSYFNVPASQRARIAQLYEIKDGRFEPQKTLFTGGPTKYISGAGGLISCAHDMLNFELMLLDGGSFNGRRILKTESVALMSRNHVGRLFADWFPPLTAGNGFGLGVRVLEDESRSDGRAVGAFGWGGAYGTETWADPKLDLAAVLLIQGQAASSTLRADFTRALRGAIVA